MHYFMKALGIILSLYITPYSERHLTLWVAIGICGPTCGVHDKRRHHESQSGSLIVLRSMTSSVGVISLGSDRLSGSCAIGFETRKYYVKCVYDYGCESSARLVIVTPWLSWRILL